SALDAVALLDKPKVFKKRPSVLLTVSDVSLVVSSYFRDSAQLIDVLFR
ncbi:12054_t:CDS:1, partial [Cetraspora pellucida]